MTEGPLLQHDRPMCVRIWLEMGHECEPRRSPLGRALALDWRVWVRGRSGRDISTFVHKVVFHLHPPTEFVYPKRVLQEPPYEIQESGCASIKIPIHVYLKYSHKPKKICLCYSLHIDNSGKSTSDSQSVFYDLENPPEALWRMLMKGGGELIPGISGKHPQRFFSDTDESSQLSECLSPDKTLKYKRESKKGFKLSTKTLKLVDAANINLKKLLNSVSMTKDEIEGVSRLYVSSQLYEHAARGLVLPPFSDPIYRVEIPPSLQPQHSTVEKD